MKSASEFHVLTIFSRHGILALIVLSLVMLSEGVSVPNHILLPSNARTRCFYQNVKTGWLSSNRKAMDRFLISLSSFLLLLIL